MKLYDKQIQTVNSLLANMKPKKWLLDNNKCADVCDKDTIIFRDETAYELGSMEKKSVCSVLFTDSDNVKDEIFLYGKDITEIKNNSSFSHIVIVGLDNFNRESEFEYEELKDIEFSIYRLSLKGYYTRISPVGEREQVRISKEAVNNNLSFENIGNSVISEFKKNPLVQSVKVIFITEDNFDYKTMSLTAHKVTAITKTLTTKFGNLKLDCSNCSMKPICDEVEGLRELHFSKEKGV